MKFKNISKLALFVLMTIACTALDAMHPMHTLGYYVPHGGRPLLGYHGGGVRKFGKVSTKGIVCKQVGCRKVKVTGAPIVARSHNAVVCKGNACRRAVIRKQSPVRRRYGHRGYRINVGDKTKGEMHIV